MIPKKVIVCDLDGTLTKSKSALSPEMAEIIPKILEGHFLAVVSGGAFPQFEKQFLSHLKCGPELLANLYLFPTMGSTCYTFNVEKKVWQQIYNEPLSEKERQNIISVLKSAIAQSGLDLSGSYGEIIEDRGSQVTFSGRGQNAPIEIKEVWDKNQAKRRKIVEILKKKIPQFEITLGGSTSIDITKKGLDKAYAIGKIMDLLKVEDEEIIFVGDALYKGGNDEPVKKTEVDYIQEAGPDETLEFLKQYITTSY